MDLYSAQVSYAINKDISVGADLSFLQAQNNSFSNGVLTAASTTTFGATTPLSSNGIRMNLWNFGVNAKAGVAGFKLYGTADIQEGRWWNNGAVGTRNRSPLMGMAFTAGGSYTLAPVTLALNFGYGSGDSKGDNRKSTFMTSQSDVQHFTFIYDYMTANAAGNIAGGLQNTMFAQFAANADVMKSLNIAGSLTFLQAAKSAIGGGGVPPSFSGGPTSHRYIGTEADATITYQIDKGLKYYVEGGYLFAGNQFWMGATGRSDISNPWAVRQGIQLNF
jgi:hypothetical protein